MNLLQLVCHEEAVNILQYLTEELENCNEVKEQMVTHRDSHLGSQAIHLAAATGNHQLIDCLINHYAADANQTTNSG
jgi:ankyrin repeat protein